jgi:PAS domain S-box-containing protein
MVHPEDADRVRSQAARILTGEASETLEHRIRRKNGAWRWVSNTPVPRFDPAGTLIAYDGIISDITERKRAEEALRNSEEKHRIMLEESTDPIFSFSGEDGRYTYVNRAFADGVGKTTGEIIGRTIRDVFPGEEAEKRLSVLREVFTTGREKTFEARIPRPDGDRFYITSVVPIKVGDRVTSVIASSKDITERKRAEEALRHSMQTSDDIVRAIPSGFFIYQYEIPDRLILVSGNPEAERLTGISLKEWKGREFNEIWPEAKNAGITERYLTVMRTGATFEIDDLYYADNRLSGAFRIRAFMLPQSRLAVAFENITERKRNEEALWEEKVLLSKSQAIAHVGSWKLDLTTNHLTWSDEVYRIFGCRPQEFAATYEAFLDFVHPDDRTALDEAYSGSLREGADSYEIEHRIVQSGTGDIRWVHERCVHERDDAGKIIRSVGMVHDITERKRAEASLRQERERLAGIIRGTNAGTWEWNVQTGETIFNERWAEIIGYTLDEISPVSIETWMKFTHPDDLKTSDELLQKHFSGELDYYECEARMRHKSGEWVWVLDRGRVTTWTDDGKPLMMMGTHQDITERKRAELEREKLQEQLVQAQKMESVGRLAGGVAHDYNNMLGVILGHAEMALERVAPTEPLCHNLKEIRKAAERSADLTRQLLAFARKQTVAPKVLDLNKTVRAMSGMLRRLIGEDIDLAWMPGKELWTVNVDPSQIDQILANLCVNARDAIAGVGKVTVETGNISVDEAYCADHAGFVPGEYVLLAVSDNGCGMDAEVLSHLFEPFFTTKALGQGTGLGLATVYGAVKQNNGFINVYSELGQGTTFKIYLPRHAAKQAPPAEAGRAQAEGRGSETILLVEDEPAILKMVILMLEREGYTVLGAGTPGEAIRLAREHAGRIDLLMSDVVMPEMNGRDLAKNILSLYPDIRLLFMSGYTANVIAHQGVLDPGVHFLQKPFSRVHLIAKLREALDRG